MKKNSKGFIFKQFVFVVLIMFVMVLAGSIVSAAERMQQGRH